MATIIRRETKTGPAFKVQVKVKNKGSGKIEVHATTWKPSEGMTEKQMQWEVQKFAEEYETNMRNTITMNYASGISGDMLVKDYANWWLERRKSEISASYYSNCKSSIEIINEGIGGFKLRELNPIIIQQFYDQIDQKQKEVVVVTPKPKLKETMKAKNMGYQVLRYEKGFNSSTLSNALRGDRVSLDYAERLSACLGEKTEHLFKITRTMEPYAFETIHKVKRTLRVILATAKRQLIISENYAKADFLTFPKRPPREIDYMNDEEATRFYAAADRYHDIRLKTAALTLLLTGIRRGELTGLEWGDIDLKKGTLKVQRSVTTVGGIGRVEKDPKTASSKRVLSISDKLISVLKEYRHWYIQYRLNVGDRWTPTDRLFIAEDGKPINPGTIDNWVDKICDAAGLPHRTVHSLRHTNITMQIAAGVPLVTVSGRAGHARTSTTADIYSHFLRSSDKTAAEKLEQVFEENSKNLGAN